MRDPNEDPPFTIAACGTPYVMHRGIDVRYIEGLINAPNLRYASCIGRSCIGPSANAARVAIDLMTAAAARALSSPFPPLSALRALLRDYFVVNEGV